MKPSIRTRILQRCTEFDSGPIARHVFDQGAIDPMRTTKMSPRLLIALLCAVAAVRMPLTAAWASEAIAFKKSPVKLIDTGLENMEPYPGPSKAAVWVDDHRLLAGVPLERSAHDPKRIGRTVIYDLNTGKARELMRYAHPLCWDAKTGNGALVHYPNPQNPRNQEVIGIRVDQSDAITERKAGKLSGSRGVSCDVTRERDPDRILDWLRPEHGYIDLAPKGKRFDEMAILYRPDGTKRKLPFKGGEINGLRYLAFLDKYQLDNGSGCLSQGEKCPPDIHVMSPSGDVTTIVLPARILDLIPVTRVYVVNDGLLFRVESIKQPEGYLLLRDGVLHQLWRPGAPGFFNPQRTETWGFEANSPDGCKVAFARGVGPSRVYVFDHCAVGR